MAINWIYVGTGIVGVLFFVAIVIFIMWRRKKRKFDNTIPPEIEAQFQEAERRYLEANGRKTHHEILWELAREHFNGTIATAQTGERSAEVRQSVEQRTIIPSGSNTINANSKESTKERIINSNLIQSEH